MDQYDGHVEINPVLEWTDDNGDKICEVCEPEEASFWSVYLHLKEGGVDCIADCPDQETASFVADAVFAWMKDIV